MTDQSRRKHFDCCSYDHRNWHIVSFELYNLEEELSRGCEHFKSWVVWSR